jgi:membrane protein required for beta-lactamase induction
MTRTIRAAATVFGAAAWSPVAIAVVAATFALVCASAAAIPAWRAARAKSLASL